VSATGKYDTQTAQAVFRLPVDARDPGTGQVDQVTWTRSFF